MSWLSAYLIIKNNFEVLSLYLENKRFIVEIPSFPMWCVETIRNNNLNLVTMFRRNILLEAEIPKQQNTTDNR